MEKHGPSCGNISHPNLLDSSIFHVLRVGLPSMAPQTLSWGWFEPSCWLEVFLEDRTHSNDVVSGVRGEVMEPRGKKGGLSLIDRLWLGVWLCLSLAESLLSSISAASTCRVIIRMKSNKAGKALHGHGDLLINVTLIHLPASRYPLQVAALPQSYIPQYKVLGNHLVQTPQCVVSPSPSSSQPSN